MISCCGAMCRLSLIVLNILKREAVRHPIESLSCPGKVNDTIKDTTTLSQFISLSTDQVSFTSYDHFISITEISPLLEIAFHIAQCTSNDINVAYLSNFIVGPRRFCPSSQTCYHGIKQVNKIHFSCLRCVIPFSKPSSMNIITESRFMAGYFSVVIVT